MTSLWLCVLIQSTNVSVSVLVFIIVYQGCQGDHFFGLGLGLTVIGLGLGLGLMRYWSRVSYVLVSWSQSHHLLS